MGYIVNGKWDSSDNTARMDDRFLTSVPENIVLTSEPADSTGKNKAWTELIYRDAKGLSGIPAIQWTSQEMDRIHV